MASTARPIGAQLPVVLIIVLFGLHPCIAKSIYVAQTARGNDSGIDTANAHAAAWLNLSASWGSGASKIEPGDSVRLCGTIAAPLKLLGSGTAGKPVTIHFERDAKLSKPHWNQGGGNNDAAINANTISNVIIDGGANGLVECTDNGTMKTNQVESRGLYFYKCSSVIVRNMHILNMYVRVASPTDAGFGSGIYFRGSSNISILNNVVNDAERPIDISFDPGDHDYEIAGNSSVNAGEGSLVLGSSNTGATITGVRIHHNSFSKGKGTWSGNPDIHTNCMHLFAVHDNSRIDSVRIYSNRVTGDWGSNSTSYIFLEGTIYNPQVYNNIFMAADPGEWGGNAYLYVKHSPGGARLFNNTFIGNGGGMNAMMVDGNGATITNNLCYNVTSPVECPYDTTGLAACDYNNYYAGTIFCFGGYSPQMSLAAWKLRTGFDQHSTTAKPQLDAAYAPLPADTAVRGKGVNLSAYCATDFYDRPRPSAGAWDMGAVCATDNAMSILPGKPFPVSKLAGPPSSHIQLNLSRARALGTTRRAAAATLSGKRVEIDAGASMVTVRKPLPAP